ncbi:hypothetical protein [Pseudomonas sp. 210_17 TE3656]
MFENFTRRNQLDYEPCDLRYKYLPNAFRYDLLKLVIDEIYQEESGVMREYSLYRRLSLATNQDHVQLVGYDDIHENYSSDFIIELLRKAQWHEMLSIAEEVVASTNISAKEVNRLFEYHNIGYELVQDGISAPWQATIKYSVVIEDIGRSLESAAKYPAIVELIERARHALADPKNIDIATSISNSVKALEGFLREWLQDMHSVKAATLGDAVKEIKRQKLADENIIESLHQFYIYRNRTPNIAHGNTTYANATENEALLVNEMAVSFINYFSRYNLS